MMRLMSLAASVLLATAPVWAEQYWIAYEGNDFPENEGWWRIYSGGGAERWIEDGMLVLDGLADLGINDVYGYNQYPIDPGPGELFVAEFRFSIDEIISGADPGIGLFSDESWAVGFSFSDDSIRSDLENETFDFDFVGFHTFRLTSSDMRNYTLEADGEVIREGVFLHVTSASQLRWGDSIEGGASLTRWDYTRFGVVPEPSAVWLVIAGLAACVLRTLRGGMRRVVFLPILACILAASATAEPYWIAYEGNDFPENEGWIRIWNPPLAERWIEEDALVIDSRASGATNEWYELYPEWVNPQPGELFIARWRLRVDELTIGWRDPTVGVFGDDSWGVGFNFNEDTIESVYEDDVSAHFEPHVFHDFELRTADMRTYHLYIDGSLAIQGAFWDSLSSSRVGWGDTVSGGASLTHWDYFRFGVVPEPCSLLMLVGLCVCAGRTQARLSRRNRHRSGEHRAPRRP